MSMEPKLIAYAKVAFGEAGAVADRVYNCTIAAAGAGVGDFNLTIGGNGGADRLNCQIVLIPSDADASSGTTIHTSDTVKRIQFRDAAGALASPSQAWVEVWRLPPLPAP